MDVVSAVHNFLFQQAVPPAPNVNIPRACLVTGGSGFVGQRLVEMLVERGSSRVVSFDVAPKPKDAAELPQIEYIQGDLTKYEEVEKACSGVDCVFHIAALVGPYHPKEAYYKVNVEGTKNVLDACKKLGIKRIVMSSSPSTRFPYPDPNVRGFTEEQLVKINGGDYAPVFLQPYAETKALGERLVRDACGTEDDDLLTIAVAPHQVYGPRDGLFLPNLLQTAGSNKLRIIGNGENVISFCHVDNYCHGLILGYAALFKGSPALGKYYVVTDGAPQKFWKVLDQAIVGMGFNSLTTRAKMPGWFVMAIAHVAVFLGNIYASLTGTPKHIVNFRVKLNPFAVKMLTIDRHFDISGAERDLKYTPLVTFDEGWKGTIEWFKANWLPKYKKEVGAKGSAESSKKEN
jgi:nucleoside-diphosphate-sugar epimerase